MAAVSTLHVTLLAVLIAPPQSLPLRAGTIAFTVVCGLIVAFALFVELRGSSRQYLRGRNATSEPDGDAIKGIGSGALK